MQVQQCMVCVSPVDQGGRFLTQMASGLFSSWGKGPRLYARKRPLEGKSWSRSLGYVRRITGGPTPGPLYPRPSSLLPS
ncbi:hypothetical protein E2C01_006736 [Portunus trituberculatus]|uniref:Uncharacterized protein n=1 Tax=Portunus trituberculatus TaxID=210409 RepID=A0A5B7D2M0_PORTR|nr:hypothetical protein [Portunus trituberculatus]